MSQITGIRTIVTGESLPRAMGTEYLALASFLGRPAVCGVPSIAARQGNVDAYFNSTDGSVIPVTIAASMLGDALQFQVSAALDGAYILGLQDYFLSAGYRQ